MLIDSSDVAIPKVLLKNSILHNVSGDLIAGKNFRIEASNCLLTNAKGAIVHMIGGSGKFSHCTLANYYEFAVRQSPALVLQNLVETDKGLIFYPVEEAIFENCIISGSLAPNEIRLIYEHKDEPVDAPFVHLFNHCLLGVNGEDDENFIENIWNKKPEFINLNTKKDFVYNFRLDSLSVARNYGDRNVASRFPDDIDGHSRLMDDGPDLGCYEFP
jgi:hypothetical protein